MEGKKVYGAIAKVAGALSKEGISKDRKNKDQNFNFRGIDDVLNVLSGLLVDAGLVVVPQVEERVLVERTSRSGGALYSVTVRVRYTLYCVEDGSSVEAVTYGEAMDSADKATNKAMSASYKYFAILSFCIPTEGDNDADAHAPDPAPGPAVKRGGAPATGGSLEDRAKAMNAPANNQIPPQVLGILDALDSMDAITAKCSEYKPMAQKEGWGRALGNYWTDRNAKFKELQEAVFGTNPEQEGN